MIVEPKSNLLLPPSLQPVSVAAVGPFRVNELIPLKGMHLLLSGIVSNGEAFQLTLVPHSFTAGYLKRAAGKKGKAAAKRVKRSVTHNQKVLDAKTSNE